MMLPNINQQAQGLNVQTPRVPGGNQMMGAASQARANMPQRPVQSMAPDNGQHGGAQRYMSPMSGAMNQSNQRQPNPYGNQNQVYPGQRPPPTMSSQPQAMANQAAAMPQIFTQPMQQYGQAIQQQQQAQAQRQMPYNMALQQRIMGQGMPQMFGPVGP